MRSIYSLLVQMESEVALSYAQSTLLEVIKAIDEAGNPITVPVRYIAGLELIPEAFCSMLYGEQVK